MNVVFRVYLEKVDGFETVDHSVVAIAVEEGTTEVGAEGYYMDAVFVD
jgi:hypothetical protein